MGDSGQAAAPATSRRGLLRFGTAVAAATGASTLLATAASAAPGDKGQPTDYIPLAEKGASSGVATLDGASKLPAAQLPDLAPLVAPAVSSAVAEQSAEYSPVAAGALGNGVQDDSSYLQRLIDDAAAQYAAGTAFATRQVVVQLPRGRWAVGSALQLKTGVRIRGVGKASAIAALPGFGASAMLLGTSGNTVTDAVIEDLAIDGSNSASPAARSGIQVTNGARISVRRVHFSDFGGAGVLFQGLSAGGGTPDSEVIDCTFDGIGLADGTTGFGILFKDASQRCVARGNRLRNIKGGMGVGGNGSAATGFPLRCSVVDNHITMAASTTGFEGIGWTAGCDFWLVSSNHIEDSQDNGISASGSWANVAGNTIDGAWDHGISSAGQDNLITGNEIRNVGRENPAAGYAFIAATSTTRNFIAYNKGLDDQGTTTYGMKFNTSGGANIVCLNSFTGQTGAEVTGSIASDTVLSFAPNGIRSKRLQTDILQELTANGGISVGSTFGMNGLAFTGSGRLGSGQHIVSSNVPATRPALYCYAKFNQAADLTQWAMTASDNITQTVRAGVTSTGRIYSSEGVQTRDLGPIDGKTSAQIDGMFLSAPTDGTIAVATLSSAPVFLHRRGGKWSYAAATQIA
jgi:hypothetical protein